jgi:hypothetical protein
VAGDEFVAVPMDELRCRSHHASAKSNRHVGAVGPDPARRSRTGWGRSSSTSHARQIVIDLGFRHAGSVQCPLHSAKSVGTTRVYAVQLDCTAFSLRQQQ